MAGQRLKLCCVLLWLVGIGVVEAQDVDLSSVTLQLTSCNSVATLHALWKESGYGKNPNRIEQSAWVIRSLKGNAEFVKWPQTFSWAGEVWKGPLPANIVAQVHTHPASMDQKPSVKDAIVARKAGVFVYVVSEQGIWSVSPDGKIRQDYKADWFKRFSETCGGDAFP